MKPGQEKNYRIKDFESLITYLWSRNLYAIHRNWIAEIEIRNGRDELNGKTRVASIQDSKKQIYQTKRLN